MCPSDTLLDFVLALAAICICGLIALALVLPRGNDEDLRD